MDGRKKAAIAVPVAVAAAAIALAALWPSIMPSDGSNPPPGPGGNNTNTDKVPINILSSPSAFAFVDKWIAQYNSEQHLGTARADYSHDADEVSQYSNATGFLSANAADLAIAGRAPSGWGNEMVIMPISPQAIAIVYNVPGLPDVPSGLKLDAPTLSAIFSGNITQWDDPRIKDKNPDTALPAEKIAVVHEGRAGTPSDLLGQYMGNATAWPADSMAADSPEDLSTAVRQTPYSIGYIDFSYAIQTRMTYAALANADGEYVLPSIDSIGRAIQNGTAVSGNSTDLSSPPAITGQLGTGSYPIVSFYYVVLDGRELAPGSPGHAKAAAALDFANWAAGDDGQRILVDMQYPWIYSQSAALAGYATTLEGRYHATLATMNYTAPANFTDNASDSVYGQVVAAGDSVHVVWQESIEGDNYDILLRSSTDSGATFGNATNISDNAGFSEHPQLAASGDNVYVVWPDNTSGERQVMYARSTNAGKTFSEPAALSSGADSFNAELAAFDSRVYVVWQEQDRILLRESMDGGETFGELAVVTEEGVHTESYPKVAAYGDSVHIAWLAEEGVYYSSSAGPAFPVKLSGDVPAGEAQVAEYNDSVYVVWGGSPSVDAGGVYLANSADGGETFAAPVKIESDLLSSPLNVELAVAPAASGHTVYVAAQAAVSENEEIMLLSSSDGGATFTPVQNLSNNSGISECPSVSVAEGRAFVVWEDGTTGNHEIFLAQRPA